MRLEFGRKIERIDSELLLLVPTLLFKLSCDLGYWVLASRDSSTYHPDFNPLKFSLGLIWCLALFFAIDHGKKKSSVFLLMLVYLFQIIPITTIYALENGNSIYYHSVCFCFLLCELLVRFLWSHVSLQREKLLSVLLVFAIVAMAGYALAKLVRAYGRPSTAALNIYNVYQIRRGDSKDIGRIVSYLLSWSMAVFLPFGIAKTITDRKYIISLVFCLIVLLVYLYTGNKTYLFSIPLVVLCTFWSRRERFFEEIFFCACLGFFLLVVLACLESNHNTGLFSRAYSLLGRRVMIVPANNKFKYYDYFSNHPKMGIYGIFPRWMIHTNSYYENIPYTYEISEIYYGKPEMNSNTGFLAEGYMRFGHIGTLLILLMFALFLKGIDSFQTRTGYSLAVGAFVYPVYSLSDAHMIDSLFFGPWMMILLLLLFYRGGRPQNAGTARIIKLRERI